MSRYHWMLFILYIIANIFCNTVGVKSSVQFGKRAGVLAVINMTPLLLGGRTNIFVYLVGLRYTNFANIHRWVGRVSALQGVVHGIIYLLLPGRKGSITYREITLISTILMIFITSVTFLRRLFYEVFLKLHLLLSLILVVGIWLHLGQKETLSSLCLLIGSSLWLFSSIIQTLLFIYRNIGSGPPSKLKVQQEGNLLKVEVTLKRPWDVKPGQYVYLTVPSNGYLGILQAHPYYIAWWGTKNRNNTITLLIQTRTGFSKYLNLIGQNTSAILQGPWGHTENLHDYDKVLMFASGIGLAVHLPYIRYLLELHNEVKSRVRRLTVVWLIEESSHDHLLADYMSALLKMDSRRILILHPAPKANLYENFPESDRLKPLNTIDVQSMVEEENAIEAGNMVVSVCAPPALENEVRAAVKASSEDIRLMVMDYQPDESLTSSALARNCLVKWSNEHSAV
ncbi:MAG: hypothetical protein M1824_001086 [Vezdaea acicularis]|nr:MAG: hypothetical protein M1824_001086 [Vezdaea acicularis]